MDETDELTAYHEAGHAVVATVLGATVEQICTQCFASDGADRHGDLTIRWPADLRDSERVIGESLVSLAGPAAEMIYRGERLHPGFVPEWAYDWQQAWEASSALFADERQRLRQLEMLTNKILVWFEDDTIWQATAVLADEILAHEVLEREEIAEALGPWLPRRNFQDLSL